MFYDGIWNENVLYWPWPIFLHLWSWTLALRWVHRPKDYWCEEAGLSANITGLKTPMLLSIVPESDDNWRSVLFGAGHLMWEFYLGVLLSEDLYWLGLFHISWFVWKSQFSCLQYPHPHDGTICLEMLVLHFFFAVMWNIYMDTVIINAIVANTAIDSSNCFSNIFIKNKYYLEHFSP